MEAAGLQDPAATFLGNVLVCRREDADWQKFGDDFRAPATSANASKSPALYGCWPNRTKTHATSCVDHEGVDCRPGDLREHDRITRVSRPCIDSPGHRRSREKAQGDVCRFRGWRLWLPSSRDSRSVAREEEALASRRPSTMYSMAWTTPSRSRVMSVRAHFPSTWRGATPQTMATTGITAHARIFTNAMKCRHVNASGLTWGDYRSWCGSAEFASISQSAPPVASMMAR